ncbi:phage terminase small subunit P27 family [Streptomyces albidoflavus]|uniref:phage terminase small subunit P27 family n=1 Tax=Streptomyces albidoflavus TaxID=1886 RepID=UPI00386B371E|nr:phage terminase small subunit P27 family [Streptomyces albidoflavus]
MADPQRRKPALQVVREGNPGKRPVQPGVILPPADLIEPDWAETFSADDAEGARCRAVASAEWRRVVPVLRHTAGVSDVDTAVLHDYCVCVARVDQGERALSRDGVLMLGERGWQKNGWTTVVGQYRSQIARYIGELGLSPSARGRIQPPERDADDDGDVFD